MFKKISLFVVVLLFIVMAMPYLLTWNFVKSLPSLSQNELEQRIDVPMFRESLKQSITGYMSQQADQADPMAQAMMKAMLTPIVNKTVDAFMQPEVIARLFATGNIKESSKAAREPSSIDIADGATEEKSADTIIPLIYFTGYDSYRVRADKVLFDFHFNDGHWQLSKFHLDAVSGSSELQVDASKEKSANMSKPPVKDEIIDQPLPEDLDPSQIEGVFSLIRSSFFIRMQYNETLSVEIDTFLIPNAGGLKVSAAWDSVLNKAGENILLMPQAGVDKPTTDFSSWGSDIPSMNGDILLNSNPVSNQIDKAEGLATISLPISYDSQHLLDHDRGKVVSLGPLQVTLNKITNDGQVSLNLTGTKEQLDKVQIYALNVKGQMLAHSSTMRGSSPVSPDSPELISQSVNISYKGNVDHIALFMPDKIEIRILPVQTHNKPETFFGELRSPITTNRYQQSVTPRFCSAREIIGLQSLTVKASRSHAYFGFNTPEVEVLLPECTNSKFAKASWEASLFDSAGEVIPHTPENGFFEYRFKRENGSNDQPVDFHRATGSVTVDYPVAMTTQRLDVSVDSPRLTVSDGVYTIAGGDGIHADPWGNQGEPVRGYDEQGRMLVTLDTYYKNDTIKAIFWGKPARIEVDTITKRQSFIRTFELAPAVLLSESCQGQEICP